ncbi:MAG TPA: cupin domain-containing protein [Actinomycetota bacterium]|nr:cupin domain-containing protein [Actinomycetota bacterium]
MSPRHLVARPSEATYSVPPIFEGRSDGVTRWLVVDEAAGAVHTGFGIGRVEPGGFLAPHVHSYEESLYVLEGEIVLSTAEAAARLVPGDYGLIPLGMAHTVRNESSAPARWATMTSPQPRSAYGGDTQFVPPFREHEAVPVDVRDPRNRLFGHISPENMDPARQTREDLAVSASMRTALLVYVGISVKMMVDSDLGAHHSTMFMVEYQEAGGTGAHDHPLEETYLILEGAVDAEFDGAPYRLEPGDVAWAGVGCVHRFANPGPGKVRWLETQAPAPPPRNSYRFARDWEYLRTIVSDAETTTEGR